MNAVVMVFSWQGRLDPAGLCKAGALSLGIAFCFLALDAIAGQVVHDWPAVGSVVAAILFVWTTVAATIKRLHDLGLSGWWALIFPAVLVAAILVPMDVKYSVPAILVTLSFVLFMAVAVAFMRGQIGANKFGQDPFGDESGTRDRGLGLSLAIVVILVTVISPVVAYLLAAS